MLHYNQTKTSGYKKLSHAIVSIATIGTFLLNAAILDIAWPANSILTNKSNMSQLRPFATGQQDLDVDKTIIDKLERRLSPSDAEDTELRDRIILAIAILEHGGPLDIKESFMWFDMPLQDIEFDLWPNELITEQIKNLDSQFRAIINRYAELSSEAELIDNDARIDKDTTGRVIELKKRYLQFLEDMEGALNVYINCLSPIPGLLDRRFVELKKDISDGMPHARRMLLNISALRLFIMSEFEGVLEKISLKDWLPKQNWDTKVKGAPAVNYKVIVDGEIDDVPLVIANPDLLHLAIERIISNGFHIVKDYQGKIPYDLNKVIVKLPPGQDKVRVGIVISTPGNIDEAKFKINGRTGLPELLSLDYHRPDFNHGIGLPFTALAIHKMGGNIKVQNITEKGNPRADFIVELPTEMLPAKAISPSKEPLTESTTDLSLKQSSAGEDFSSGQLPEGNSDRKLEEALSEEIQTLIKKLRYDTFENSCEATFKLTMRLVRVYISSSDNKAKALLPGFLSELIGLVNFHHNLYRRMTPGTMYYTISEGHFQNMYNLVKKIYSELVEIFQGNEIALALLEPVEKLMERFGDKHKTRHHVDRNVLPIGDFIEQFQKAVEDTSRLELLQKRYPMEGVRIEVKNTAGFLATKGIDRVHRVNDKHYIIEFIGVPGYYRGYVLLHAYLHIWHKQRGLTFDYESEDDDIKTYLWLLRDLVADYIVEKEIHKVFGDSYDYIIGDMRDTNLIEHASGAVHTNGTIILMLGITGKVTTLFYPKLRNSESQRFIPVAFQWSGLDDVVLALENISIRSTPEEFREAVSELHNLITKSECCFAGNEIIVNDAEIRDFTERINTMVENVLKMARTRQTRRLPSYGPPQRQKALLAIQSSA